MENLDEPIFKMILIGFLVTLPNFEISFVVHLVLSIVFNDG